jgi:hypothetical protein
MDPNKIAALAVLLTLQHNDDEQQDVNDDDEEGVEEDEEDEVEEDEVKEDNDDTNPTTIKQQQASVQMT